MKRIFSLFINNVKAGFYESKNPNQSARKIFRNVCRKLKNLDTFDFEIIDVKTEKVYKYSGTRKFVDKIKQFKKYGEIRNVHCKYEYSVKRIY